MFSKTLVVAILLFAGQVRADEQVRGVQEELRRRNVYFGDIDGQRTPELEKATKRYQKRKGFPASGTEDPDTLRSLGLLPRSANEAPPKELEWPTEPVLKSDAKIDIAAEANQIGTETGVAPASLAPEAVAAEKPVPPARVTPRISTTSAAAPARPNSDKKEQASAIDQLLEPTELREFAKRYVKAASRNDVRRELKFYADQVSYFDNGKVDRRIIESTLKRYYQRWPSRKYSLEQAMSFARVPGRAEIVVLFRVNFTLKNHGKIVRGQTENRFTINAATADPRIVSIQERRVRL